MRDGMWRYWWPDRGEKSEDWREYVSSSLRDPERVAMAIAERDWSKEPWQEEVISVQHPNGEVSTFVVRAEMEPSFILRKKA